MILVVRFQKSAFIEFIYVVVGGGQMKRKRDPKSYA